MNEHCIYIYLPNKKSKYKDNFINTIYLLNRGSGPPLLWPLMTRNYVISILTTTPKFISTREALLLLLLLLLLPLKNLTRTQEKKIVEKEGDSC